MSIRILALSLFLLFLAIYAWKDWFVSLCGLILVMAVIEHPDMPKSLLNVQGLNLWNILLGVVLCAWVVSRRREGLTWDMPGGTALMLILYLAVVLVGFARMMADRSHMEAYTSGYLISENLVNCIKWVIPGLLLFDGCRTRRRLMMALACVLGVYILLAVQIIRWMPPGTVMSGADLTERSRKILLNEVGFHAVNLSMLLAGASWAVLAALPLMRRKTSKLGVLLLAGAVLYGQALTAGRMGYATWAVVGLILCVIKWRKLLVLLPVVPLLAMTFAPGAVDRMLMGFGQTDASGAAMTDDYLVTSGRTLIWPLVIDEIQDSPFIGHGRKAMVRSGLYQELLDGYGESFPHPHNAYLEWLFDNGAVGLLLVMPFYAMLLWRGLRLFLDRSHPVCATVGGLTLALVLALLVASVGSQTFYPREGAVGMWCAVGLMLRVWVERARLRQAPTWNPTTLPVRQRVAYA